MALLGIDCQNGKMLCDKKQYGNITLFERVKLAFYLLICGECREYTTNNNKLTKYVKKSNIALFTEREKEALKQKLAQQLKNS